jgi:dynein heavy chain, axonemal
MSVILLIGNPKMKTRHWNAVFEVLKMSPMPTFTLSDLKLNGVFEKKNLEQFEEISGKASGEAGLEESLKEITSQWDKQEFIVTNYRELKGVFILGDLEEVFQMLEDSNVSLQTMLGSRYITAVRTNVELWYKKLCLLSDTLDEWVQCQKQWMYLETIFCAEDIQKQLPEESSKFFKVDKEFKSLMRRTQKYPGCLEPIETGKRVLMLLKQCNNDLEEIQKRLEDYLETKRSAFPRFYFLSNDELLEILSQTRDPQAVQPHLGKCFDAIAKLDFQNMTEMHAMIGAGKPERVQFTEPVIAEGPVEHWLLAIESMMRSTLYDIVRKALKDYPSKVC